MAQRFPAHIGVLDKENCPLDPTSPVPPPWDSPPSAGGAQQARAQAGNRVAEVGAMLAKWARNPDLLPYERLFRAEPDESWFDLARDPDHPTQFEIAALRPEAAESILIFDYDVTPFAFSGVTSLDYEALADNMLSGVFGYSIRVNGQEPGNLRYGLQPIPSTIRQQAFEFNRSIQRGPAQLTADDFAISSASDYGAAAGFGTALHPQTSQHYGARPPVPFTEFVHENEVLQITGVVFRPIDLPLAFIQARVAGFKGKSTIIREIETALRATLR